MTAGKLVMASLMAAGMLTGCANYEVNSGRGNVPGYWIRYEMQEADRAVEAARKAGKDKSCPNEFKAAEAAKNNAYDVFRSCRTEEGAALAKKATAMANMLCPAVAAPIPVPTVSIVATPAAVVSGQSSVLNWSSKNATDCAITPEGGKVPVQGSMTVTPAADTLYTLTCSGQGGTVYSSANVAVTAPAPVVEVAQPQAPPAAKLCSPTAIRVQFDTGKSDIKPQYHDELKKLADFLNEFPTAKGTIEGHTDSVGSRASNMKLSLRRANSIRDYLIKHFSIAPERITAQGFGPDKPIASNKTREGKAKNRRIVANFTCPK